MVFLCLTLTVFMLSSYFFAIECVLGTVFSSYTRKHFYLCGQPFRQMLKHFPSGKFYGFVRQCLGHVPGLGTKRRCFALATDVIYLTRPPQHFDSFTTENTHIYLMNQ